MNEIERLEKWRMENAMARFWRIESPDWDGANISVCLIEQGCRRDVFDADTLEAAVTAALKQWKEQPQ